MPRVRNNFAFHFSFFFSFFGGSVHLRMHAFSSVFMLGHIYCREVMKLKMKEQRLIIKGRAATVLLSASLPFDDGCDALNAFYTRIYSATVDAARKYADVCDIRSGGIITLSVSCTETKRRQRILIERKYTLSHRGEKLCERTFVDTFDADMRLLK